MPPSDHSREWADPALVGKTFTLLRPIVRGHGELEIAGQVWKAVASEELDSGTRVRVAGVDGRVLKLVRA